MLLSLYKYVDEQQGSSFLIFPNLSNMLIEKNITGTNLVHSVEDALEHI